MKSAFGRLQKGGRAASGDPPSFLEVKLGPNRSVSVQIAISTIQNHKKHLKTSNTAQTNF